MRHNGNDSGECRWRNADASQKMMEWDRRLRTNENREGDRRVVVATIQGFDEDRLERTMTTLGFQGRRKFREKYE
uniref:Uncharacterized protein n=1 Tax=Cucumis melo TaxID=3656 RepID=A0A9I9CU87_CUCME